MKADNEKIWVIEAHNQLSDCILNYIIIETVAISEDEAIEKAKKIVKRANYKAIKVVLK